MTYPENCIRGVPNSSFLPNGNVGAHLFYFKNDHSREDGYTEQSINWEDNDSVVEFTLNQQKEDGELQFKVGVVKIPRLELDRLNQRPTIQGLLSYERQPLDDNPYHGNILLRSNVPKHIMKTIAAGLSLAISEIILNESK